MFNAQSLLRSAVAVGPTPDEAVDDAVRRTLDQLVHDIRRKDVMPFRIFRRAKHLDLKRLEETLREYHELSASGCGLDALERLTANAYPYVYPLRRGIVRDVVCDQIAVAGAFDTSGTGAPFVTVMTWSIVHDSPGVLNDVDVWEWVSGEPEERLLDRLEALYLATEHPEDKVWTQSWGPHDALLMFPTTMSNELPRGFERRMQAAAASESVRLQVPDQLTAVNNLISADGGKAIQVYVSWARFERLELVRRAEEFYDRVAEPPKAAIRLESFDREEALKELRAKLAPIVRQWEKPKHRGVLNEDGWYYLQKRDSGGGRDDFTPRDGSCGHNNWFKAGSKAPQARKGAYDFFHGNPEELQGCLECHCYRARFN